MLSLFCLSQFTLFLNEQPHLKYHLVYDYKCCKHIAWEASENEDRIQWASGAASSLHF